MTKLLIGNDFIDEIRSDDASTGWWVQRIAWFAEHGDVLVLGEPPDWDFLRYVGRMLRVEPRSWTVVVVQDYLPGTAEVSGETLLHPDVVAALRTAVERAGVDRMVPVWPDPAVGVLAEILGLEHALPGYGFIRQSGGRYGSSKALFRAAASRLRVPIAPGAICTTRTDMIREARRLLEQYGVVMFKHELIQAGRGNEIVSLGKRVQPIGAPRVVELSHDSEIDAYVAQRWDWLSSGGRARSIVERYYPGSTTLIAEFECTDEGVRFDCDGELLLAPLMAGQVLAGARPRRLRACGSVRWGRPSGACSASARLSRNGVARRHCQRPPRSHLHGMECAHHGVDAPPRRNRSESGGRRLRQGQVGHGETLAIWLVGDLVQRRQPAPGSLRAGV